MNGEGHRTPRPACLACAAPLPPPLRWTRTQNPRSEDKGEMLTCLLALPWARDCGPEANFSRIASTLSNFTPTTIAGKAGHLNRKMPAPSDTPSNSLTQNYPNGKSISRKIARALSLSFCVPFPFPKVYHLPLKQNSVLNEGEKAQTELQKSAPGTLT